MPVDPPLRQLAPTIWQIDQHDDMRVPARILASRALLDGMDAAVFEQIRNVATLPGIVEAAYCMPDGHSGYGFPIGGTAAMDADSGVISPGGIGFDINCGMRLIRTNLSLADVKPHLHNLVDRLYASVPVGTGRQGLVTLNKAEFRALLHGGAAWCVQQRGLGWDDDLAHTEENGAVATANTDAVSARAIERGYEQIGTLGSGNHYLEIQVLRPENIYDRAAAQVMGLGLDNQIVVMFHCGSRGFGHQVASDYLGEFLRVMHSKYHISVRDRQLAALPFQSPEGQRYFQAMNCAINMAFANRQAIVHQVRKVFAEVFGRSAEDLGMHQVYDISHNTAKLETHLVNGTAKRLLVHRKGATRAFGPGMSGIPADYSQIGQPVIIGGSMETGSYLLTGVASGASSFYTTAHGSGRTMSRSKAKKLFHGQQLQHDMATRGIYVKTNSFAGLAEEAGGAYKDIDAVVDAAEQSGVSRRVARLLPIGNIKG